MLFLDNVVSFIEFVDRLFHLINFIDFYISETFNNTKYQLVKLSVWNRRLDESLCNPDIIIKLTLDYIIREKLPNTCCIFKVYELIVSNLKQIGFNESSFNRNQTLCA